MGVRREAAGLTDLGARSYATWLTPERLAIEEVAWETYGQHALFAQEIVKAYGPENVQGQLPYKGLVLEVGCGTGRVAAQLPLWMPYLGVDANPHCLALAQARNPGRTFLEMDLRAVRPIDGECQVLAALAVFKHIVAAEWGTVVRDLLQPARHGVFSQPIADIVVDDGSAFIHQRVTREWLEDAIDAAGHRVVSARPIVPGDAEWVFVTERR